MGRSYEDLQVWQKAINIAEEIYSLSSHFPSDERFGLTSQLRRASVSIASNIAEGASRPSKGEFKQFIGIASGSVAEVKTQIIIAKRIKLIDEVSFLKIVTEIDSCARMLNALRNSLISNKKPETTN